MTRLHSCLLGTILEQLYKRLRRSGNQQSTGRKGILHDRDYAKEQITFPVHHFLGIPGMKQ